MKLVYKNDNHGEGYIRGLLEEIKERLKLKDRSLSEKLGVGYTTIGDWKAGRSKPNAISQFGLEVLAHQDKIENVVKISIQIMAGMITSVPITKEQIIDAARSHPLCQMASDAHEKGEKLPLTDLVCRIVQCRVAKHLYPDLWEKMGYME